MALFQGQSFDYWSWITLVVTLGMAACIWFVVMIGREKSHRKPSTNVTTDRYGDLEDDHAPVSSFLKITFAGVALWALGYLIWTGVYGVTGF